MSGSGEDRDYEETSNGLSRRRFLTYAAGGVAGIALLALDPGAGITRAGILSPPGSLDYLDKSIFARHLGETFTIRTGAFDTVDVKLVEVSDCQSRDASSVAEAFSVVFHSPRYQPLEQGTYTFEHGFMGAFPLFIVPAYPDGGDMNYVAVFNRLKA
jgi:hypothetical protein